MAYNSQQRTGVRNIFCDDSVGTRLAQVFDIRVRIDTTGPHAEPVALPHPGTRLVNQSTNERLLHPTPNGLVLIVGQDDSIGHDCQLIAVGTEIFLCRSSYVHVVPASIQVGGKIVEVSG